jgi:hypothetical protein
MTIKKTRMPAFELSKKVILSTLSHRNFYSKAVFLKNFQLKIPDLNHHKRRRHVRYAAS